MVGIVVVWALSLASAGGSLDVASYEPQSVAKEAGFVAEDSEAYVESGYGYDEELRIIEPATQPQERLIIRNADLSVVVDDTVDSIAEIERLTKGLEGWIVSSNIWEYEGVKRGNISVRVPSDQLDSFLSDVRALVNEVTNESISGQDVTEEYVDLQAQLTNLEATADRVRSFLDEARTVEEALDVNRELGRLEGEIERITGRMKYLESSARQSLVSIDVIPDELVQPVTVGGWRPEGTARDAIRLLINTLQWLADVLIFLALFLLPVAFVLGAPVYVLIRLRSRRRRKQEQAGA
jgi:hypothetical protein